MARIIAIENVTLDGVMQAPAAPDEDTRGEFPYGGWGQPYGDEISMQKAREGMASEGAMLFGRVTYEKDGKECMILSMSRVTAFRSALRD